MTRQRADVALVARGLAESRAKAQEAIAAGLVSVDGSPVRRASDQIDDDQVLTAERPYPWVSRAGLKLEAGLDHFGLDPAGRVCLDVGASTGGFTRVLLARGAALVHAVDVGRDQLHPSLRADPRVVSREATNARTLSAADFPEPPSLVVCDASFISLRLVLPRPLELATPQADLVALIKPQFEAGPAAVKKGIVRDEAIHARVCAEISDFIQSLGWQVRGIAPSPIEGGDGNREFLLGAFRDKRSG